MPSSSTRAIDVARIQASEQLDQANRAKLGQFMTPTAIADFMASLFTRWPASARLLDPGAGVGSLTEAFARRFFSTAPSRSVLEAHCYEIDPLLTVYLREHMDHMQVTAREINGSFRPTIHDRDFIEEATFELGLDNGTRFSHAILNPPYKKIGSNSVYRKLLRKSHIETVNLYTAFLGLAIQMVENGGEVVAIIPRSFCNGTYFRPFRNFMLERVALRQIHVFQSRSHAFKDDDVLQENIIVSLVKGGHQGTVTVSESHDPSLADFSSREIPFAEIVFPKDVERFIHVPTLDVQAGAALFSHSLTDLGLEVSTGPVVDFRVREHWLAQPTGSFAPLLYSHHFRGGDFTWPKQHKKPNALALNDETRKWLLPKGYYTVTKRFSSKEERRRLVAYVVDPNKLDQAFYGFENHMNVFHAGKKGIPPELAHGLALFLNSTVVDNFFRNFSGHTQVNATDLRTMRYPSLVQLRQFGIWAIAQKELTQTAVDRFIEEHAKQPASKD